MAAGFAPGCPAEPLLPRRIRQVFAGGPCRKAHAVSHGFSDVSSAMVAPLFEVIAASIDTARLAPGRAST